jgi:hypothetical protein
LDTKEGKNFVKNQIEAFGFKQEKIAIFDIGWRGKSLSRVRELGQLNAVGFFLMIWPWARKPKNCSVLLGSRYNFYQVTLLRRCPEILEFILSSPHQSMQSSKVQMQMEHSPEFFMCKGFEKALQETSFIPTRRFISHFFNLLLSKPTLDQATFFGSIHHSINGETARKITDPSRILWLSGARVLGIIKYREIILEFSRRFLSLVRGFLLWRV